MVGEKQAQLRQYIENHAEELHRILRHYTIRFGLATVDSAPALAEDIMQEVVVQALRHADRLQTPENPMPWLLGIGVNMIRRRRSTQARLNQREPLIHDLYPTQRMNEDELIDHFIGAAHKGGYHCLEDEQRVERILSGASPEDQHILRLAILHDLNGEMLAEELGISAGAARVRLHRALKRLRGYWGTRARVEGE